MKAIALSALMLVSALSLANAQRNLGLELHPPCRAYVCAVDGSLCIVSSFFWYGPTQSIFGEPLRCTCPGLPGEGYVDYRRLPWCTAGRIGKARSRSR
jgi:hypothetical protein